MSWSTWTGTLVLAALLACRGGDAPPEEMNRPLDEAIGAGASADSTEPTVTVTQIAAETDTEAGSQEGMAPEDTLGGEAPRQAFDEDVASPPGAYVVESHAGESGKLPMIEYATPRTVQAIAEFYDGQLAGVTRVELEVADQTLIAYGLGRSTSLGETTTFSDLQRLLETRTERIAVVSPWTMSPDDPLIRDLVSEDLEAEAEALLQTRSKVTIVYAPRPEVE